MACDTDIELRVLRLSEDAALPAKAHPSDAGLDLRSAEDLVLQPFERHLTSTGLAVAIPDGCAGLVMPRSGLAVKKGLSIVNTPGLVDCHYRGELRVCLVNLDPETPVAIAKGDRIAQLVVMPTPSVRVTEVGELDTTDRGTGGFGSTGVH